MLVAFPNDGRTATHSNMGLAKPCLNSSGSVRDASGFRADDDIAIQQLTDAALESNAGFVLATSGRAQARREGEVS